MLWGREQGDRDAARAKVVRDALRAISRDLEAEGHQYRATAFDCASCATDATLAKLGRMLR